MSQSDMAPLFSGTLDKVVGSIFPSALGSHLTPGGTLSDDAKETNGTRASAFPPDGSPIVAPASGEEGAMSRLPGGAPVKADKQGIPLKKIIYIVGGGIIGWIIFTKIMTARHVAKYK